jgi:glutamate---cysteine ligase / carboxylate-amine ligase
MQTSLEVEYWVIDSSGELTSPEPLAEISERTEREFVEPLFELKTPPCESVAELEQSFLDELAEVLSVANQVNKGLVPLGTPINSSEIQQRLDERGRIQRAVVGEDFDYAKHCAGTHIHFEQRNVVDQLNALIALDSALALVNSSPYYQGERVAAGARAYCYRRRGYAEFPKHGQLWHYVESVGEWHRRLERRFEEFKTAALEAGVDEAAVDANFSADNVVWTPVRLRSEMPTVEWRSPDSALPSQIFRLVRELYGVMEALHHANVWVDDEDSGAGARVMGDTVTLPSFETACELVEQAMHDGLDAKPVTSYLDRMGFSVDEYEPISARIDGRQHVSRREARALRLEYANRLEADVDALRANDGERLR